MVVRLTLVFALLTISDAQQTAFPGIETNDEPRKSVFPLDILKKCPPNQVLYPGYQSHDWICDCSPGYIYYPPKDGCFEAYRRGPCDDKKYLILPKNKVIPECVDFPCQTDGFVQYQGKCHELGKSKGLCKPANEGGEVFGVNTTTLALECLSLDFRYGIGLSVPASCLPGSRRSVNHYRELY